MKKTLQAITALLLTVVMVFGMVPVRVFAQETAADPVQSRAAYPTYENVVPEDWENDLWLQYDHKSLEISGTADLYPRRVPQIIDDPFSNNVQRPNFRFAVVEGDSVSLSVSEGKQATVTAQKAGTSVVMVTYDAATFYGKSYGASAVVNTAYAVYTVGETGTVTPVVGETLSKLTKYDTLYYTDENYPLTFTAAAEGATVTVTCNGEAITADSDGSYTANLANRSNIIGVVATDASGNTKSYYKVVDARKIEISITNKTYPGVAPAVGDTVNVRFQGITMPVYKLATIYNPCANSAWGVEEHPEWDTTAARVSYQKGTEEVVGKCGQYDLSTNNDFDVVLTEAGTLAFTNGVIKGDVYANAIGADQTTAGSSGSNVGSDYPIQKYTYSILPGFSINVAAETTAVKLESIAFGKSAITLYKDERLTQTQLLERLGGVTLLPADASNKTYTWSSSDPFTLNLRDGFFAQQLTQPETPVKLTATTVDGGKTAVCDVAIVERPAAEEQKAALNAKIAEAEKVKQVDGTESAWQTLKTAIQTANGVLVKPALTGKEATKAVADLAAAIAAYQKAVENLMTFQHTVAQEKTEAGTQVTLHFPNMPTNLGDRNTTSLMLTYTTNIPNMTTVATEDYKDNTEALKTLSFVVPKAVSGTFALTGGHVKEDYSKFVHVPFPHNETGTNKHYLGDMPDILLTVDNGGAVLPPVPKPEEKQASISIDKLTIGKGYVLETTVVSFADGESVWDATKRIMDAKDISYDFSLSTQYNSVYVSSIAGDGEFDHGPGSGWMYSVNGVYPQIGCSAYSLKAGDVIRWRYTTNLGQDLSEGGSDNGAVPPKQETQPGSSIAPTTTVSGDSATATVTDKEIHSALDMAKKNGTNAVVIAPAGAEKAKEVTVKLPKTAVESIVKGTDTALSIETNKGTVRIPNDALKAISEQAEGGNVEISVVKKSLADIGDGTINTKDAVIVEITVKSGDKSITSFGGKSLTISVPAGSKHESGETYKVIAISADGKTEVMTGKCVTVGGKLVVQTATPHLTTFVVTAEKAMSFADVTGHWGYDAISYVSGKGLMGGVGNEQFDPDGTLNRAMLVTILYRLENSPAVSTANLFADVAAGQYYTDAVIWASDNKIVSGLGDGKFAPNANITREQMATMLHNYAQYKKHDVTKSNELTGFTDANAVSSWALSALKWANAEGLITGRTETTIVPSGTASRAEAAAILMRFMENAAN